MNSTDSNPRPTAVPVKSGRGEDGVELLPLPVFTLTLGAARGKKGRGVGEGTSVKTGDESIDMKDCPESNANRTDEGSQVSSSSRDIMTDCVGSNDNDVGGVGSITGSEQSGPSSASYSPLNGVPNSILNVGISGSKVSSRGRSKGVLAAKLFVEEHYLALHRYWCRIFLLIGTSIIKFFR